MCYRSIMLTNIRLLTEACKALNIHLEILHYTQNLVRLKINNNDYYFTNYTTPFLSQSVAKIFQDKDYVYHLFKNRVNLPRTESFLSPYCPETYHRYLKYKNIKSIVEEIEKKFSLPIIMKKNSGSSGTNVFLCYEIVEVKSCLDKIFDFNTKEYDYIALAQEYIDIIREYRAVIFKNELLLVYEKSKSEATFVGNLSPLHWEGAKAIHITEPNLITDIKKFVEPMFEEMEITYGGLDIAIDKNGKYWLIEINSHPNFDIFIRDNDENIIREMFKKILNSYL